MVAAGNCRRILMESRNKYLEKIQDNLAELRRESKKWWRLTEQTVNRQANPSFFAALKDIGGNWCVTPREKADAFARCWSAKFAMLPEVEEQFFSEPDQVLNDFMPIRQRAVKRILANLKEDQATGPDGIPALVFKRLSKVLSIPFAILTRRILNEAVWPEKWKQHSIVPIFKKGSTHSPNNFRGIHLTTVASKVVERCIISQVNIFLQSRGFGTCQWAYKW